MSHLGLSSSTPEEAVRRLALHFIDEAQDAARRVGEDDEALHDLRVALRRLRTTLRAYRGVLEKSVGKKMLHRLRDATQKTSAARDNEVQLGFLKDEGDGDVSALASWLEPRFAERARSASRVLHKEALPELQRVLPRLRKRLERYAVHRVVHEKTRAIAFGSVAMEVIGTLADDFEGMLRRVKSVDDEATAHRARIFGKRLRYVLEPFAKEVAGVDDVLAWLKTLQNLLGEAHDLAVRTELLTELLEEAVLERARERANLVERRIAPGSRSVDLEERLLELLRRSRRRKETLFEELTTSFLGDELSSFVERVHALGTTLSRGSDELPREIERKYLLSGLPERVQGMPYLGIEQGYLPGQGLHERLRRTERNGELVLERCIKLGRGLSRIEVEEATTAHVFSRMWPLTKGKRVKKRRYEIEEGDLTFQIDSFLDRELTLCEVELEDEQQKVEFPSWLAPWVVREVTEESGFTNLALAR